MDPESRRWKRTDAIRDVGLALQKESLMFNEYVESMSENFRQATFAMVGGTDWSVVRGKAYQWSVRPGVRCR